MENNNNPSTDVNTGNADPSDPGSISFMLDGSSDASRPSGIDPKELEKIRNEFSSHLQNIPDPDAAAANGSDPFASLSPPPQHAPERISYIDSVVTEVPLSQIVPNPYQPRKFFNQQQLEELAASIKEHGVIQPLVVNKTPIGYELVVGERRFRASELAGLEKVPVIIKQGMQDQTKLEVALIENIQRQELNPIEEAQAYDKLMKQFGMTQEQVAQKVGKSRPAIANTVRLLNLPAEIQRGIIEGKISEGHARAILGLTGVERQLAMFRIIQEQNLNVRQVESKVRELMARPKMDATGPDPKVMAMENELRTRLGTRVRIEKKGTSGRITIEFFSEEELSELIEKIEGQH